MTSWLKVLCLAIGTLMYTSPAYAYLDPGTGSMLLQALIGGIAAGFAVLSLYWQKVKAFFAKGKTVNDDKD